MEMPKYRMPTVKLLFHSVMWQAKSYLKKAGTFILAASVIVWFASNYPQNLELSKSYEAKIEVANENKKSDLANELNEKLLEYSHSRFNIFTIIREGTEEVGLHSAFIGELLNPKGLHQMGSTFLELFLNEVLPENEKLKIENTSVETHICPKR